MYSNCEHSIPFEIYLLLQYYKLELIILKIVLFFYYLFKINGIYIS